MGRLNIYKKKYNTIEGVEDVFGQLVTKRYVDESEGVALIRKLVFATQHLNAANIINLPKDTWGHGDFKPENILLHQDTNQFYFIDSDMHWKPGVVDVAKMVSRTLALGLGGSIPIEVLHKNVSSFLKGYYGEEPI